jgi:hypothetical protein
MKIAALCTVSCKLSPRGLGTWTTLRLSSKRRLERGTGARGIRARGIGIKPYKRVQSLWQSHFIDGTPAGIWQSNVLCISCAYFMHILCTFYAYFMHILCILMHIICIFGRDALVSVPYHPCNDTLCHAFPVIVYNRVEDSPRF